MSTEGPVALPDYSSPPVNEAALSIQFAPIAKFGIPHFGLYWGSIREQFPRFEVHPALPAVTEIFGEPIARQAKLGVQLMREPDVRCWFLDPNGASLFQVQRDRFVHNWRQVSGEEPYPRYPKIRQGLADGWHQFCVFLQSEGFEVSVVNQCEVTYVNHIPYNVGWRGFGELGKVISPWSGLNSSTFLPDPERGNMELHYRLPNDLGRLHIALEPVLRGRDFTELLQLTLTARGAPASSKVADIFAWLDIGREWVVKGFTDFTTPSMHAVWGRRL